MSGRSWPQNGAGGTLSASGSDPGPYYCLSAPGVDRVGSGDATAIDLLHRAVWYGVLAIQRALNRRRDHSIGTDGVFGEQTKDAVITYQKRHSLPALGVVGPITAKALFAPTISRLSSDQVPGCLLTGQIQNESGFDPGAVGYVDDRDLGLLQINGHWHPDLSESERFSPVVAINFAVDMYEYALSQLNNNLRDSVASYNLGIGGAKTWISAGRPDVIDYYDSGPVKIKDYIDRILAGCQ